MGLSYSAAWADAVALFRSNAELILAVAGIFILLPAVAAGFLIPDPVFTTVDLAGRLRELLAHARQYAPANFLLSIPVALGQVAILSLLLDPARPTVAQALRRGLPLLVSFILLNNVLINITVVVGLMLLILPGLYLLGRLAPASPAMVADREMNPLTAYARGWEVSRGNGWRIFGLIAIIAVVAWVVNVAVTSIVGGIAALVASDEIARVVTVLVEALGSAAIGLVLLLVIAAVFRQLAARGPAVSLSKGT